MTMPADSPEALPDDDETQVSAPPKRPPAGLPGKTPIVTARRIIRMQDVSEGDHILDRDGTWQPVTKVHRRKGNTVRVSGRGHAGIELTDDHPVLVRNASGDGTPGWLGAGMLAKQHTWATPTHVDPLPLPTGAPDSPAEWQLVGSYLRDGTIDGDKITLRAADQREARSIRQHLAGWTGREDKSGGVTFEGRDQAQAKWLAEHFGDKPHTKTVPPWALGMDENHRRALLKGYYGPEWKPLPTASPFLVTGMGIVSETLGERTDIKPVLARWRQTYQARKLEDGHGSRRKHSWLGNQQARKAISQRQVVDLEVGGGAGGSFVAGIGSMVVSAAGEKPEPKPNARSRAQATPPARTSRNGGGGDGSNGRSAQSPDSKPRRMPRTIPSVASVVDALGSSLPVVGGRKPRSPQRDMVPLTPAQEQRVQQGVRSLDGIRREEDVANSAAVPQSVSSPRAQRAARAAENALFIRDGVETNTSTLALDKEGRVVGVPSLKELRQVDRLNGHEQGTAASILAKQHGLVKESVPDVLAAERPAREQRVINDWDDATTINHLGKVTAEQFLPGHLAHPNGHSVPDQETALIKDDLIKVNQAGFTTIGSQPGMANSVGYHGNVFHQNAAVQGFAADPAKAEEIQAAAEREGLTVIRHTGAGRWRDYSNADLESGFGTRLSRSDVETEFDGHMSKQLRNAEQITVIDEEIGRNDRLARFADSMDRERRSDPINDAWMVDDLNGLKPGTTENDMRRARGEAVPDLRDELRTPAEREEREARMAAAEQVNAQDREQALPRDTADRAQPLPMDQPDRALVGDGSLYDGFAAGRGANVAEPSPPNAAGQPVAARVDGRPVPAEIIDAPAAHGQPERVPAAVDSYGFAPGLSAPPDRQRLEPGSQEPDLITQIADARALREMQAVPVGREQNGSIHSVAPPLAMPIDTPRTSEPAARTAPPASWEDVYARHVQSAAAAREAGFPVDRPTFDRNLDEAWQQLQREQSGAGATEPWRERGLPQAGEGELRTLPPLPVADHNGVAPEDVRGLLKAGQGELPPPPGALGSPTERAVAPEHERGLKQIIDAELTPPPTVTPISTERPSHNPDVLERHGLADLARSDAPDDTPAETDRKPLAEDDKQTATPVDDAVEEAGRTAVADDTREQEQETAAKEPEATPDAKPVDEPAPEPAEERTPETKPEPKPVDEPVPEPEPEAKPKEAAEPETTAPEVKEAVPEPAPDPAPEREPQWKEDAAEAIRPADPEPAHSAPEPEAPSHHMGPEL